jgi:recombination protein RecR
VYEGAVQDLIDELGRLPGIGPKGAQRIAFSLLTADAADIVRLMAALHLRQRLSGRAVPDLP